MTDLPPVITLLTDFGEHDSYVGAMKGVILGIVPDAKLVDITHQVEPQNIQQAASILFSVYRYFPAHTVHLIVVDPGVGSERRAIAFETPGGRFVAPDNGVLTYVTLQETHTSAVILENPEYRLPNPSHTFHGRDIFSPAAAHLARGVELSALGSLYEDLVTLPLPSLEVNNDIIKGEVIRFDRFGNALTNIMLLEWIDEQHAQFKQLQTDHAAKSFKAENARVTFSWHTFKGLHKTYSQVPIGQSLVLIGSTGELEIAVNQGSAQKKLSIEVGDPVTLQFSS